MKKKNRIVLSGRLTILSVALAAVLLTFVLAGCDLDPGPPPGPGHQQPPGAGGYQHPRRPCSPSMIATGSSTISWNTVNNYFSWHSCRLCNPDVYRIQRAYSLAGPWRTITYRNPTLPINRFDEIVHRPTSRVVYRVIPISRGGVEGHTTSITFNIRWQ